MKAWIKFFSETWSSMQEAQTGELRYQIVNLHQNLLLIYSGFSTEGLREGRL